MAKQKLIDEIGEDIINETKSEIDKELDDLIENGLEEPRETFIERLLSKLFKF